MNQLVIKADGDTPDDKITLSDTERTSYEKTFSSILVPFASLAVGEDIGQGMLVIHVDYNYSHCKVRILLLKHYVLTELLCDHYKTLILYTFVAQY